MKELEDEQEVEMHLLTENNVVDNEAEFLLEQNDENLLTASKFKFVYFIKCCVFIVIDEQNYENSNLAFK